MNFEANRPVKTTEKTFAIIEHLSQTDRISLSQLAEELDESKGIVHNHVSTLRELGYIRKIGDQYQLSPKLLSVGFQTRSHNRLFNAARSLISELSDRLNTGIILCELSATECVIVDSQNLSPGLDIGVGTAFPLSESITGLVAAGSLPDEEDEDTNLTHKVAPDYDFQTINTNLAEQGYVVEPLASSLAVECVAVPLIDDSGDCYGSAGVILPDGTSSEQTQRITDATVQLRSRIESRLSSDWGSTRSFATEKHSWIS